MPAGFPPLQGLDAGTHNLPVQPTPLIGREKELGELRALLARGDVRLLTLTGPGGTGKTRLALQVAADLLDAFSDGVFFVDLAPLRDPGLVASAIAQPLGVREAGSQPLRETLQGYLREKQMLLVLDNFEQVLAAAPGSSPRCWRRAPALKALVTSRALLRLRGEQSIRCRRWRCRDWRRLPPLEGLAQVRGGALFVARAVDVEPEFASPTDECGGRGGDLRAAGRAAAGHRAGGGPRPAVPAAAPARPARSGWSC